MEALRVVLPTSMKEWTSTVSMEHCMDSRRSSFWMHLHSSICRAHVVFDKSLSSHVNTWHLWQCR